MQFLEQLGNLMGLDEVSKELGFDLQTDAVLARAEQLTKLEGDRLADKVLILLACYYLTTSSAIYNYYKQTLKIFNS